MVSSTAIMERSNDASVLPARSKSKRSRTSSSSTSKESSRRAPDQTSKAAAPSSSTSRSGRPSLTARTSSAPLVPLSKETPIAVGDEAVFNHRDSVTSIKDDPFFRNYQSPNSVSLARELRSATYTDRLHNESLPENSNKRPTVDNSVNLPVCSTLLPNQFTNADLQLSSLSQGVEWRIST